MTTPVNTSSTNRHPSIYSVQDTLGRNDLARHEANEAELPGWIAEVTLRPGRGLSTEYTFVTSRFEDNDHRVVFTGRIRLKRFVVDDVMTYTWLPEVERAFPWNQVLRVAYNPDRPTKTSTVKVPRKARTRAANATAPTEQAT